MFAGHVENTGAVFTVSPAAEVETVALLFVNTALYFLPFESEEAINVSGLLVAPTLSAQEIPSALTCHCNEGAGWPDAVALNVAVLPAAPAV